MLSQGVIQFHTLWEKERRQLSKAWKSNPEVTEIFRVLSSPQGTVYEEECHALERFVVVMYSRTCPHQTVNEARHVLFAQGNKSIENIPPTQAALAQHIKRAAYQAGHVPRLHCSVFLSRKLLPRIE